MKSHRIGKIDLDEKRLSCEIEKIHEDIFSSTYSEYAIGKWRTCSLANKYGNAADDFSYEYNGSAKITEIGELFPYFLWVIKKIFIWEHIKSIRIFSSKNDGMIIPHRDYLEFEKGFTRIHIPIQTDLLCLNSERHFVYNMKVGEIWFLEGNEPHSAGCFGKTEKLSLVVDFDLDIEKSFLFKEKAYLELVPDTELIQREPMDSSLYKKIRGLHKEISVHNFNSIVSHLAKIHFYQDVSCVEMYNWLDEISGLSGNDTLRAKSKKMREHFMGEAI